MSDAVRTIKESIEEQIQTELGASYSRIGFVTDITKNSYRQNDNRYGVNVGEASQQSGVTQFVTMSQSFEVVLTKGYARADLNDDQQVDKALDLYALAYRVFKRLVNSKAGSPTLVININNLEVSPPEYNEDEKVVAIRAAFDVFYRISL